MVFVPTLHSSAGLGLPSDEPSSESRLSWPPLFWPLPQKSPLGSWFWMRFRMDEGSRILLLTGLSWLLELPLSVLVVVVVVVVVVAAPRFFLLRRQRLPEVLVARDVVVVEAVVILIFVIIIVLNLMVGVAGGDEGVVVVAAVSGTPSSAMHHAVDSDVSWVSCMTCRR